MREIVVVFVRPLDVPVIVTVAVPVVAVVPAASVKVLVLAVLVGLNVGVTPFGRPDAEKLTVPVKPFNGLTVMVALPVEPCAMVRLLGDAESVKVGGGFTVSEMVAAPVRFPAVPAIVTVTVPVVAVLLALRVSVLVLTVLVGLNDGVTPAGRPEAEKATLLLKPFSALSVMVLVPPAPCTMVKLFGAAESVKLPWGLTVRESVVLLVTPPEVPLMVTV